MFTVKIAEFIQLPAQIVQRQARASGPSAAQGLEQPGPLPNPQENFLQRVFGQLIFVKDAQVQAEDGGCVPAMSRRLTIFNRGRAVRAHPCRFTPPDWRRPARIGIPA
jgi:hypothetical protein